MYLAIRQITRDLFAEKTRMVLTVLAIAWAPFTITSMLSIGEGLRTTFGESVAGFENQIQITGGKTTTSYRGLPINQTVVLRKQDYNTIKTALAPYIKRMTPIYVTSWNNLYYHDEIISTPIKAVNANHALMGKLTIEKPGRLMSPLDIQNNRKVVILGADVKFKTLKKPTNATILINGQPFKVIGQYESKSQLGGRRDSDAFYGFIPSTTYEQLMNPLSIDTIAIQLNNDNNIDYVENELQKIIAFNHHTSPDDTGIIHIKNFSERQKSVNDFFFGMQIFLGIIGALTLMVAGVGIANVMYASVSRATHEIGIRMAIGARTTQILSHYMLEALAATLIGGTIGLSLAAALVFSLNHLPFNLPDWIARIISKPEAILSIKVVATVIVVLGLTGLLAGLFPALKAARIDPAEALRYE